MAAELAALWHFRLRQITIDRVAAYVVVPRSVRQQLANLGLFRKGRTNQSGGMMDQPDYHLVRNRVGAVVGLWLANPQDARNRVLIAALLLKHDQHHLVSAGYRLAPNDVDDNGGLFVLFDDDRPQDERSPQLPVTSTQETASLGASAGRKLTINGRDYPLREDFEAFSRDALAGNIALLGTTIADASWIDHTRRLREVLAATFGDDAPETRAAVYTSLCCLTCLREYPYHALMLRDFVRGGGSVGGLSRDPAGAEHTQQVLTMTACVYCGGQNAAWIYVPTRRAPE